MGTTAAYRTPLRLALTLLAALSLIVSQFVIFNPLSAEAAVVGGGVDGGGFEIDGNFVVDGAGSEDWSTRTYTPVADGGLIYATGSESKEADRGSWAFQAGAASPPKDDLLRGYIDGHIDVAGDEAFIRVAAERDKGQGTAWASFEFNQDNPGPFISGTSVPRTPAVGDLLVSFEFPGNQGDSPEVIVQEWGAAGWQDVSVGAFGAANSTTITSLSPQGGSLAAREFMEVSVDVSFLFDAGAVCRSFGQAWVRSNTAWGDTGRLKDVLSPVPFGFDTCGQIEVTKVTQPADLGGSFDIDLLKGSQDITTFSLAHGESDSYGFGEGEDLAPGDDYRLVEEDLPAGWSLHDITCEIEGENAIDAQGNITVGASTKTECVVTNKADDATITVVKKIDSEAYEDAGGAAADLLGPDDFPLSVGGESVAIGIGHDVAPGSSYTISETQQTGYRFVSLECDDGTEATGGAETVQVTPDPGEQIECTFVNEPIVPQLKLKKVLETLGDEPDSFAAEDFGLKIGDELVDHDTWNPLPVDTYTISEVLPDGAAAAGYQLTGISCTDGTLSEEGELTVDVELKLGDEITCTFTNSEVAPTITVIKELETLGDDDPADLDADDFELRIDGKVVAQNEAHERTPDTYTIDEIQEDGYELVDIDCGTFGSTDEADHLDITVGLGDNAVCTITNAEIAPTITLIKELGETYGGDRDAEDFRLDLNDQENVAHDVAHTVAPGSNTVAEVLPDGYRLDSIVCVDGDETEVASTSEGTSLEFDVALGDDITCTFTNDEIQPTITLVKQLGATYGADASPDDFDLELNDVVVVQGDENGVDAGSHDVSEEVPAGFRLVSIVCVDADENEVAKTTQSTSLSVDVALGDDITCTFTNDGIQPQLTLVKEITTDLGGPLEAGDFELNIDGDPVDQGDARGIDVGAYRIDEDPETGYELVSIVCRDGEGTVTDSTTDADHLDVRLGLGDDITCTFRNAEIAPKLTVLKELGETAGGTMDPEDFDLRIDGDSIEAYGEARSLKAGSYLVDEVVPQGYAFVDIDCDNDQSSSTNGLLVQLSLGDDVTCTITNDEIAPTLEVVKEVDNLTGGDLGPDDFQLYVAEGDDEPEAWDQGDAQAVTANETYTVSEDAVAGYMHVATECFLLDGDELGEKLSHPVTPSLAQDIRCIVTNEDVPPGLTINKIVENPHGGDLDSDDFTITVDDGDDVTQLPGGGTLDDPQSNVDYEIDELAVTGYELVDVSCYLGDADEPFLTSTSLPVTVNLAPGEDAYCTVTNRDIAPTLILEKVVIDDVNGGATPQDFVLEVTPDGDATVEAEHGDELTLRSDTDYTLSEQQVTGYELLGIVCDNDESTDGDELTIGLTPGEVVTCTFTNEAIAPTLTVIKAVQGGPATPSDFTLLLNGDPIVGSETMEVLANTSYEVSEEKVSQYVLISQVCVDAEAEEVDHPVVLAPGDEVVCFLVNAYADLQLDKTVVTVDGDEVAEGQVVVINGSPVMLVDPAGGPYELTYEFTVTNTGEVPLSNLTLTDPKLGGAITLDVDTIAPGETATGTATYTVTGEDLAAGSIPNTATATGEAPDGETIDDTDSVTVDLVEVLPEVLQPGISVEKTATDGVVAEEGELRVRLRGGETAKVTYTYVVTNTGDEDLTDLRLVDDKIGDLSTRLLAAVTSEYGEAVLPAGASVTIEAVHEVGADDFDGDELTNVAVTRATGVTSGASVSGEDSETVTLVEVLEVVRRLPRTGADTTLLIIWGLILTALGAAALRWPRRRRGEV